MNKRTYITIIGILLSIGGFAIMFYNDTSFYSLLGSAFIGGGIGLLSFWLRTPKIKKE